MKRFEELSQDQQMHAVEDMADQIIYTTMEGIIPPCFHDFAREINTVFDQTEDTISIWAVEPYLRDKIESIHAMKLAMLHEAGKMAKRAIYLEEGDITLRIRRQVF